MNSVLKMGIKETDKTRIWALVEINSAVLLFGLAGLFAKWIHQSAFIIVLGRTFIGALTLLIILLMSGESVGISGQKEGKMLLLPGIILALHWYTFFKAIQISTVAIGLLGYATFPLFVFLLEVIFLKEKNKLRHFFYILPGVLGIIILLPENIFTSAQGMGLLLAILAGFTFAILSIINKYMVKNISPVKIAFYQDLVAAIFVSFWVVPGGVVLHLHDILLLLALGVFCTAIAHTLFIKGMKHVKTRTASMFALLEPVYGIILAFVLLNEPLLWNYILGGIFILTSGILLFKTESVPD